MEPWMTKVISLCILFVTTLTCGLVPIQFVRALRGSHGRGYARAPVEFVLSALNCLAGGVFLGTTLLHLVPEVREDVEAVLHVHGLRTHFALAEFVIGCGFFLIMIVENVVMVLQHHQGRGRFESVESSVSCDSVGRTPSTKEDERAPIARGDRGDRAGSRLGYGAIDGCGDAGGVVNPLYAAATKLAGDKVGVENADGLDRSGHLEGHTDHNAHHHHSHDHHHHDHHQVVEVSIDTHMDPAAHGLSSSCRGRHPAVKVEKGECVHVIHPSHHQHHHTEPEQLASLRSFLLLLALSLHTVFEGLAIGLQPTNQAVWNLFIAIVVHKSVIAFSMGIQFAETLKTFRRATLFVVLFALMSPIGVAVGTGVFASQGAVEASSTVSAVLQAIAAGTFLYVTFFEVLNKEIGQDHSLLKVLFIMLGFGSMVLLNLFNVEPAN